MAQRDVKPPKPPHKSFLSEQQLKAHNESPIAKNKGGPVEEPVDPRPPLLPPEGICLTTNGKGGEFKDKDGRTWWTIPANVDGIDVVGGCVMP